MARRLLAALALVLVLLVGCDPVPTDPPATTTAPPAVPIPQCIRVSSQSWWQHGVDGVTTVPQSLPASGVGGHVHVEPRCFPVGQRVDGDIALTVDVLSHQGYTGKGDRLDVGLAPSGESIASVPVDGDALVCPPMQMCHQTVTVTVPASKLPAGPQSVRLRYLSTKHPNGERQFVSNEFRWFNRTDPKGCLELESKSWFVGLEYARAGIRSCVPMSPVAGVIKFDTTARSTNEPITLTEVRVDGRFGSDDFGTLVASSVPPASARSVTRTVAVDTRTLTDGTHCVQVLTYVAEPGTDAVSTAVLEVPITTSNGNPSGNGRGGCLPIQEMHHP